jgi:hypothetical protein
MPKGIPKPGTNWGIEVSKCNPTTGNVVYCPDGSMEETKILMKDGHFNNGEAQPLYFPIDYPDKNLQGKFKGMAVILQKCGFGTCQRCLHLVIARSSTISHTLLMQNHCSKLTAVLMEFMLSFCQSSTVN